MSSFWETTQQIFSEFGFFEGLVFILFIFILYLYQRSHNGRIKDLKEEIARLRSENEKYRSRFISLLDQRIDNSDEED